MAYQLKSTWFFEVTITRNTVLPLQDPLIIWEGKNLIGISLYNVFPWKRVTKILGGFFFHWKLKLFDFGTLFHWWSSVYLPSLLTNSSLSADSKSSAIERDNGTPFRLGGKNRPLVAIIPFLLYLDASKENKAEKCLNELLCINYLWLIWSYQSK